MTDHSGPGDCPLAPHREHPDWRHNQEGGGPVTSLSWLDLCNNVKYARFDNKLHFLQFQLPKADSEENLSRLLDQSTFDSEFDKEDERRKSLSSYTVQRGSWRDLSIVSNLSNLTQDVKGFCLRHISKVK